MANPPDRDLPRPFFLTPTSSDDHSSQESGDSDSPRSRRIPVRNHNRRRSQLGPDGDITPRNPPPSSFTFPFQAYPGNPDPVPGLIPTRTPRRMSLESVPMTSRSPSINPFDSHPLPPLPPPNPPFATDTPSSPYKSFNGSISLANLHRSSAVDSLPRASSATTIFRSPFLSPASRPASLWSPPPIQPPSASPSVLALPLPQKKPLPTTRLKQKLTKLDKPWLGRNRPTRRCEIASWWVTVIAIIMGLLGAAALCFEEWQTVNILTDSQLCLVMQDDFTGSSIDSDYWTLDVELGGFGNGEFEMTTDSPSNVYINNGQLYIMPTLTSDTIDGGYSSVMNGANYTLSGCTAQGGSVDQGAWVLLDRRQNDNGTTTGNSTTTGGNGNSTTTGGSGNSTTTGGSGNSTTSSNTTTSTGGSPCTVISSGQAKTVINPVMSGRLNTRGKKSIKYGRIEVSAKLPQGDWLWPAIWMLPQGSSSSNSSQGTGVYGPWPVSGEIDIMEARGNLPSYPAQGSNYVRSSLNYGPFAGGSTPISQGSSTTANLLKSIYGWVSTKRGNFASGFHVYAFEWTDQWMRFYTDNRLQAMININKISSTNSDSYFFNTGGFPGVAMNASSGKEVIVEDPWSTAYGGSAAAPFDQEFYMVIDLAVGGTSGWFPDSVGGKMWYDGSATAMYDFAAAQDTWSATWPSSADDRAFRIDYVKMWQLCGAA